MRVWIAAFLTATALQATGCHKLEPKAHPKLGSRPRQTEASPLREQDAARLAVQAIQNHHLTALPLNCLSLTVGMNQEDVFPVDVREKHDLACGGDPGVSPRLLSLTVDRRTGAVQVEDEEGELRPL